MLDAKRYPNEAFTVQCCCSHLQLCYCAMMWLMPGITARCDSHNCDPSSKPQSGQRRKLHITRKEPSVLKSYFSTSTCKASNTCSQMSLSALFPANDVDLQRGATIIAGVAQSHPDCCFSEDAQLIDHLTTDRRLASPSIYSLDVMDLDLQSLRRTRAKTPCFWIGQLEKQLASATKLADQYQAELPLRISSPYNPTPPETLPRVVRKVKAQESLRSMNKFERPYSSDGDTLVGSETPKSQASPTSHYFASKPSRMFEEPDGHESVSITRQDQHNIGLRICLEMLTNELATALFKNHPIESSNRASGLQIMLMIEAYESVQQKLRQNIHHLRTESHDPGHMMAAEAMLDTWIDSLYALHEQFEARRLMES
ncbi:hypothetical protein BJ878DRAFT_530591 [Calycina marina]|uniref:Uncharacterized protein n=1 Tax=Calycina marina TaxID=1763456 RepID=A0A9P8CAS8_9HELO|nr:hypothetical protein BJ878DRAFT_530591 [Calycina marina]